MIVGDKSTCPLKYLPQTVAKDTRLHITTAYHNNGSCLFIDEAFMKPHFTAVLTDV